MHHKLLLLVCIFLVGCSLSSTSNNSVSNDKNLGDERFGFLVHEQNEYKTIAQTEAAWGRPHPGPFIWNDMQSTEGDEFNFSETDKWVKTAQNQNVQSLITLWPWAEWDQIKRNDASNCKVSDEFSRELGNYRCSPYDYQAYANWVGAVVERYDGDGIDDMAGLEIPIKHWEIGNEPDLNPEKNFPGLTFFIGTPNDYGQLLIQSSEAIKEADNTALVVLAGAAGGDAQFLDFYNKLFGIEGVRQAFDIANIHCISNDDVASFNVMPYMSLLETHNLLNKPVWVTEAEAFVDTDPAAVASQLEQSTDKALWLGAQKIFYTSLDFKNQPGGGGQSPASQASTVKINPELNPEKPIETYKQIFTSARQPTKFTSEGKKIISE